MQRSFYPPICDINSQFAIYATTPSYVARFLPDGLAGMTKALPTLAQQEALFVGEGAALPAKIRIRDLQKSQLPKSASLPFAAGWSIDRPTNDEINAIADRMVDRSSKPYPRMRQL